MIDKFSRKEFEAALPKHKTTGEALWNNLGIQQGEFTYSLPIRDKVAIQIRSSMRADGHAADTGKDSIRLWYYRVDTGDVHGSKLSAYITRQPGWEKRLVKQLRTMYRRALKVSYCPVCTGPKAVYKRKKDGKIFQACPNHFGTTCEGLPGGE